MNDWLTGEKKQNNKSSFFYFIASFFQRTQNQARNEYNSHFGIAVNAKRLVYKYRRIYLYIKSTQL